MEKIKIMTQPAWSFLKENLSQQGPICDKIVEHFKNRDNPEIWLPKEIGAQAFQEALEAELPDLIVSATNRGMTEVENAKLIHTNLNISRSFATDPRLWSGLACTKYFDYTIDNILLASSGNHEINAKTILEHFVFNEGATREFEKNNTISRLWWMGDFFFREENKTNPFYLLDKVSQDINMYVSRCMTVKLFNNKKLLEVLIITIERIQAEHNVKINRDLISKAVAYLNRLGGTYSLDIASKEFLEEKLANYFVSILPEKTQEPQLAKPYKAVVKILSKCDAFTTWEMFCLTLSKDKSINHKTQKKAKKVIKEEMMKEKSDIIQVIKVGDKTYISLQDTLSNEGYRKKKNVFMNNIIASLNGDAKLLYNIISSIRKHTFDKNNLIQLEPHFKLIYGNDFDIKTTIDNGTKILVDAGIVVTNGDVFTNKMLRIENEE